MLYLVSTPIGNLGDISLRALETLRSVDMVVSEDTRKTGMLLKHFEIKKPQISFREDNETRALPKIMELLVAGKNVALVTDAGTPSVSDPGFSLVRSALEAQSRTIRHPGTNCINHSIGIIRSSCAQLYIPRVPAAKVRTTQTFF